MGTVIWILLGLTAVASETIDRKRAKKVLTEARNAFAKVRSI